MELGYGMVVSFEYINWRGEYSQLRSVTVKEVYWGWHPESQWLLKGYDNDKKAVRIFAMKNMSNVRPK